MNKHEEELMSKAWCAWFTKEVEEDIPEVGFVFKRAWQIQHERYRGLIDNHEKIIEVMQKRIDKLEKKCPTGHPTFCTCSNCTEDSPELF